MPKKHTYEIASVPVGSAKLSKQPERPEQPTVKVKPINYRPASPEISQDEPTRASSPTLDIGGRLRQQKLDPEIANLTLSLDGLSFAMPPTSEDNQVRISTPFTLIIV